MIKRVAFNDNILEGDIIEFARNSEPLYLYSNGKLNEITTQEYIFLITKCIDKNQRGFELMLFRNHY